jgi:hypothetical protein
METYTCTLRPTAEWERTVLDFIHIRCCPQCRCKGEAHRVKEVQVEATPISERVALCAAVAKAMDDSTPGTAHVVRGVESGLAKRKQPGDHGPRTVLAMVYIA